MPTPFFHYEIKSIANSRKFTKILTKIEKSFFEKTENIDVVEFDLLKSFFYELMEKWCGFEIDKENGDKSNMNLNDNTEVKPVYFSLPEQKIIELSELFKIPVKIKKSVTNSILDSQFLIKNNTED